MEKYSVALSPRVKEELKSIYKSRNKRLIKKIETLIKELSEHPQTGTGKPEQLKGVEGYGQGELTKRIDWFT